MSRLSIHLTLYVKPGCHLCDEAREALLVAGLQTQVKEQDITQDPALLRDFGTRIPVLTRSDTGKELDWPFGRRDIEGFVKRDS